MKSDRSKFQDTSQYNSLAQSDLLVHAKVKYLENHSGKSLNYFKSKVDLLYRQLNNQKHLLNSELRSRLNDVQLTNLLEEPQNIKRKHAYLIIAREHNFEDWPSFKRWVEQIAALDLSKFFCRREFVGFTNHWFNTYGEAKQHQSQYGGVLLSYKLQFLVTSKSYLEPMGFSLDDKYWKSMGFDWVNPEQPAAKLRVVEQLIKRFVDLNQS